MIDQSDEMDATYTSKEGADDEEPELDLATIPSIDSNRMKDGPLIRKEPICSLKKYFVGKP